VITKAIDVTKETAAEVSRLAVRLPPFCAEEPEVWFALVEAQFTLADITKAKMKFYYIFSQLDHRYVREVWDILISLPQQVPYHQPASSLIRNSQLLYTISATNCCCCYSGTAP
jgi:hypothetical protein